MNDPRLYPVAVGGVGGSGTRVIAGLLQAIGFHIGDDLNASLDNEWFAFLFKQRSVLFDSEPEFARRLAVFRARMCGTARLSEEERRWVMQLGGQDRLQQPADWLAGRVASLLDEAGSPPGERPWGWKEPNTHLLIDRLFAAMPALRYIHVVRDPLYMTTGSNQNQLAFWGPILLDRDIASEPRAALSYWCAAHRRVTRLMRQWPGRALMVDYDRFCTRPIFEVGRIAGFLTATVDDDRLVSFIDSIVYHPRPSALSSLDLDQFDAGDLAYIEDLGYLR